MSTVSTAIIAGGAIASAIFAAGFVRGLRQSIAGRDVEAKKEEVADSNRWPSIILAVIASAAIIASIGYWPNAVYIGPFLVLVTAAGTGLAFFLDRGVTAAK